MFCRWLPKIVVYSREPGTLLRASTASNRLDGFPPLSRPSSCRGGLRPLQRGESFRARKILQPIPRKPATQPSLNGSSAQLSTSVQNSGRNSSPVMPHRFRPRMTTPAAIITMPNQSLALGRSPKNKTANKATRTTLNLSIGATFEASPIFSARK